MLHEAGVRNPPCRSERILVRNGPNLKEFDTPMNAMNALSSALKTLKLPRGVGLYLGVYLGLVALMLILSVCPEPISSLGVGGLSFIAASSATALAGFLFGLPRRPGERTAVAPLERISDWLVAMLIGIVLSQISRVNEYLLGFRDFLKAQAPHATALLSAGPLLLIAGAAFGLIMGFVLSQSISWAISRTTPPVETVDEAPQPGRAEAHGLPTTLAPVLTPEPLSRRASEYRASEKRVSQIGGPSPFHHAFRTRGTMASAQVETPTEAPSPFVSPEPQNPEVQLEAQVVKSPVTESVSAYARPPEAPRPVISAEIPPYHAPAAFVSAEAAQTAPQTAPQNTSQTAPLPQGGPIAAVASRSAVPSLADRAAAAKVSAQTAAQPVLTQPVLAQAEPSAPARAVEAATHALGGPAIVTPSGVRLPPPTPVDEGTIKASLERMQTHLRVGKYNDVISLATALVGSEAEDRSLYWLYLGAAYGQKLTFLRKYKPDNQEEFTLTRQRSIDCLRNALVIEPDLTERMWDMADPKGMSRDLQELRADEAFRVLVGKAKVKG